MESDGRKFCENCGAQVSEATNFCPSCGAAQLPDPEIPTGPPPIAPQAGQIGTPDAPNVPPPPVDASGQAPDRLLSWLSSLASIAINWFNSLAGIAKAGVIVAVLGLAIALSPILAPVVTLVLLFSLVVLVLRYRRGRSLRGWGIAAASSLVLVVVLTGVSNAVYGPSGDTQQAAAPEVTVEEAQAEEETPVEATQEEETSVEVAASSEETLEESEPPVEEEEEDEFAPLEDTRPTPQTPEERLERNITDVIDPIPDPEYKNLQDLQIQQGAGQCYDIYVAFKGSSSFTRDWSADNIELQMRQVYEAAYKDENLRRLVCNVRTNATGTLTDNRGNERSETLYTTSMNRATADTINWNNTANVDFPSAWTQEYVHPAVTEQRAQDNIDQARDCLDDGGMFDFDWMEC